MTLPAWETLWTIKLAGVENALHPDETGRPNPVAVGQTLFLSIFSPGQVVALHARSGEIRWRRPLGALAGPHVLADGDRLYAKTAQTLYALDQKSGGQRWRFCPYGERHEWIYSNPEVAGKRLFIGDRKGWLHCLDKISGRPLWRVLTSEGHNNQVNATPRALGDLVYVATNDGLLLALEQTTGQVRWRAALDGPCTVRPFPGLRGIMTHTSETLFLLGLADGRLLKSWTFRRRHIQSATGTTDSAFVLITRPNRWLRIDSQQRFALEARTASYPQSLRYLPRTRLLYVTSFGGIQVLDAYKGPVLGQIESPELAGPAPEVRSGRLFYLTHEGTVRALRHPKLKGSPPDQLDPLDPVGVSAAASAG